MLNILVLKNKKLFSSFIISMFTAAFISGCAKPPTELRDQAQLALVAAKSEEADVYAKDAYINAARLLSDGNDLVDCKDYKGAAESYQRALDGANSAKIAARIAKEGKDRGGSTSDKDDSKCTCCSHCRH